MCTCTQSLCQSFYRFKISFSNIFKPLTCEYLIISVYYTDTNLSFMVNCYSIFMQFSPTEDNVRGGSFALSVHQKLEHSQYTLKWNTVLLDQCLIPDIIKVALLCYVILKVKCILCRCWTAQPCLKGHCHSSKWRSKKSFSSIEASSNNSKATVTTFVSTMQFILTA